MNPEPIFIVGCARSGTTLVYETLARHAETSWFSTWTDRSGRPELAVFNRLFKRGWHSPRAGPRPAEGYRLWDAAVALPASAGQVKLGAEHATADVARRVASLVDRHRRFGCGSVFVNKNTRNSRRVAFLNALYPRARFVHVVRDPLDTVSSILEVHWWRELPLWWRRGATPRTLADGPVSEARLAAELWSREVSAVLDVSDLLDDDLYVEILYEELARMSEDALVGLFGRLDLEHGGSEATNSASDFSQASIGAHRRRLSPQQTAAAWSIVKDRATTLGYDHSPTEGC